jgi:hypothetical protein
MQGFTPKSVSKALRRSEPEPAPAPPPPRVQSTINLQINVAQVLGAACSVWGVYAGYKANLAAEEQKVLELAHKNSGWLSEVDVVQALGYSPSKAQACLKRLIETEHCREYSGRLGVTIYVFPRLMPLVVGCNYCDSDIVVDKYRFCPNCGAAVSS